MSFNLQLLAARKKITLNSNKNKCIEIFRLRLGYKQSRSKCNLPVLQDHGAVPARNNKLEYA